MTPLCLITNIQDTDTDTIFSSFDLDYTLIKTKSGKRFPKDRDDWVCTDTAKAVSGKCILIFTNQGGKITNDDLAYKLKSVGDSIISYGSVEKVLYIASRGYDRYRKPNIGMVSYIKNNTNLVLSEMSYIGDAAGRASDFSCSDRAFAHNCGFRFLTPEEYLGGPPEPFEWGYNVIKPAPTPVPDLSGIIGTRSMIMMIGYPASGKSTFCKKYLDGFEYINMDTLKTKAKCIKAAKAATGSMVIDNTNPTLKGRKEYIDIAKSKGMRVYAVWFDLDYDLCKYLAFHREFNNDHHIPGIAFNIYRKNFDRPVVGEGFDDIYVIKGVIDPSGINWDLKN